jgi:hypothetical protein
MHSGAAEADVEPPRARLQARAAIAAIEANLIFIVSLSQLTTTLSSKEVLPKA